MLFAVTAFGRLITAVATLFQGRIAVDLLSTTNVSFSKIDPCTCRNNLKVGEMAAIVFHELGHNTLYIKSGTPFNESFAQLVGYRSAEAFFRTRGDSALADRARDRWLDEIVLADYYKALIDTLTKFYETKPTPDSLEAGRRAIAV